jgi:hypothetical protein
MSKSMEDRKKRCGLVYLGLIGTHPVLAKGGFKPGLKKACDSYDTNIEAYEKQVKRKEGLVKMLGNIATILQACREAISSLKTDRDKVHKENLDLFNASENEIDAAKAEGEKADPAKVAVKLKDFNQKFKKLVDQEKVHADKKEKLGSEVVGDLKKIGDSYEKESKDIKTTIDKLAATGNSLEAQVRGFVASYKKTAKGIKNPQLVSDLDKMLAPFS